MKSRTNREVLTFGILGDLRLASSDADAGRLSDATKLDFLLGDLAGKSVFIGQDHAPLMAPGGRENSWTDGLPPAAAAWRHMPDVSRERPESSPGFVLRVFDDGVLFERLDFATGRRLGEDRYVPIMGVAEALPHRAPVPQFPLNAKILVCEGDGVTRAGKHERQVTVRFPTASPVRAFDYAVTVRYAEADLVKVAIEKRVFSYGLFRPVDDATASCVFGLDELPWDVDLDFGLVPRNAFGGRGRAVHAVYRLESPAARAVRLKKARAAAAKVVQP